MNWHRPNVGKSVIPLFSLERRSSELHRRANNNQNFKRAPRFNIDCQLLFPIANADPNNSADYHSQSFRISGYPASTNLPLRCVLVQLSPQARCTLAITNQIFVCGQTGK